MRKFEALNRDEVTAALMCSFKDIEDTLAKEVSCVGCRRSVESKLILTFLRTRTSVFLSFVHPYDSMMERKNMCSFKHIEDTLAKEVFAVQIVSDRSQIN